MGGLNPPIIYIWHTRLEVHAKKYTLFQSWLSSEEKIRAEKLATPYRQNFIISRGVLRDLLAYYSNYPPQELKLSYSLSGKPLLINPEQPIEFNLSHSKNILAYAFTIDAPVGIDIEYISHRMNLDKIAYRFFPADEYDRLKLLEGKKKLKAFFKAWVKTEVLIKAMGKTLQTHPYSRYKLSLDPQLNPLIDIKKSIDSLYTFYNLSLYPNFATAVAVKGDRKPIVIKKYTKTMFARVKSK
ncbi:MAG: 4'-phosphopantetheinyl transferase superfamily protein [Candidatus Rickettsiella isopodorum]